MSSTLSRLLACCVLGQLSGCAAPATECAQLATLPRSQLTEAQAPDQTAGPGAAPLATEAAIRAAQGIDPATALEHVELLASDALAGRWARSAEARVAARYIADHFAEAGLTPIGDDNDWWQPLGDEELAPNVVGMLPGQGDDWVVVGAHYDHLRPRGRGDDRIFNGADDNASGVAGLLEIVAAFAELPDPNGASIVFIAFTGEELGLLGSRHFVDHPPLPLERLRAVVNLDMISRGEPGLIFCEGGARSPWLRSLTDRANTRVGLTIRHDEHPDWISGSDHFPFMQKGVPTLYFGVEDHADYHRVSDHADRVLPGLIADVARLSFWILLDAANSGPGEAVSGQPAN